jgi:hypothetical protein
MIIFSYISVLLLMVLFMVLEMHFFCYKKDQLFNNPNIFY